jgi:hypothetical protein
LLAIVHHCSRKSAGFAVTFAAHIDVIQANRQWVLGNPGGLIDLVLLILPHEEFSNGFHYERLKECTIQKQ